MNISTWLSKNCSNLKNKKVVITGATGGLGKEICLLLAELKADIILACRNKEKTDQLIGEILSLYPETTLDFVELDLNSYESVNNCINSLKKYNGIDVLINNAGIYNVPLKKLDSGYNNVFQVNFVYTYYLTKQLLPELKKKKNSTCITLGSVAHNYSKLDKLDIDFSTRHKHSKIYGNSKRFLMFSLYELFKDIKDVTLAIVHPGVTLTNMTNHYPRAINWLVKILIKLFFPNPRTASLSVVYGLNESCGYHEWIGPRIFNIWGKPKKIKLKSCNIPESEEIFKIAEEIYDPILKQ
jgi:NAD(P)-dependent dehydrogenase (short-subunit alcohol dehydrogenase family)